MCEILPKDNPIPQLMEYLAFVPLYEDTCLLAGTGDTSVQQDLTGMAKRKVDIQETRMTWLRGVKLWCRAETKNH